VLWTLGSLILVMTAATPGASAGVSAARRPGAAPTAAAPALSFAAETNVPVSPGPVAIAVGDFNRDGAPDLAVANRSATVTVRLGKGDGRFGGPHAFRVAAGSLALAVADLNRDGRPDLIVTAAAGYLGPVTVSVLLGKGDGTFARRHTYRYATDKGAYNYAPVVVTDLNGDRRPDVLTSWRLDLLVLPGRGDGTLGLGHAYPVDVRDVGGDGAVAALAVADLNGDHRADVVAGGLEGVNQPDGVRSVLLARAGGRFRPATTIHERQSLPVGLALRDLNGDGRRDLVTAYVLDNEDWGFGDDFAAVAVSLGSGRGGFAPHGEYDLPGEQDLGGPRVADFNGDGDLDVALAVGRGIDILLGDGDGGLTPGAAFGQERWSYGEMVAVGDFDRDGRPDLAAASRADDCRSIAVFINRTGDPAVR
jgi:hypothetical protein